MLFSDILQAQNHIGRLVLGGEGCCSLIFFKLKTISVGWC